MILHRRGKRCLYWPVTALAFILELCNYEPEAKDGFEKLDLHTDLTSMGEKEGSNPQTHVQIHEINGRPHINLPEIRGFLSQFLGKLQKHLKSRFKRPTEKDGANREIFKFKDTKINLEKQLQAWRNNPVWNDNQPHTIEVRFNQSIIQTSNFTHRFKTFSFMFKIYCSTKAANEFIAADSSSSSDDDNLHQSSNVDLSFIEGDLAEKEGSIFDYLTSVNDQRMILQRRGKRCLYWPVTAVAFILELCNYEPEAKDGFEKLDLHTDLTSMGEKEGSNPQTHVQIHEINGRPHINLPEIRGFLSQFLGKLQKHLKSRFKRPTEKDGANREIFKFKDTKINLEKQLQAWRNNPVWNDNQPHTIEVSVPKGSFCQLKVAVNVGLPPDAIYNIVTDPDNKRVFKNIQEVLSRKVLLDEGSRQVVELEQAALLRIASKVTLKQLIEPAIVPLPPISWYLRGITTRTTEMLINDLIDEVWYIHQSHLPSSSHEASRIKGVSGTNFITKETDGIKGLSDEHQIDEIRLVDAKYKTPTS
ncbi:hypothetical protein LXL04_029312 [Taraxacum kok-saghyz]